MESRDTRGAFNRKMGLLNYRLSSNTQEDTHPQADLSKIHQVIFNGKPRRVFKANRNKQVSFQDPKRVHTALREFNDLSANKVFEGIINQIQALEDERSGKTSLGLKRRATTTKSQPDTEGSTPSINSS